jgi:hypothetical protein
MSNESTSASSTNKVDEKDLLKPRCLQTWKSDRLNAFRRERPIVFKELTGKATSIHNSMPDFGIPKLTVTITGDDGKTSEVTNPLYKDPQGLDMFYKLMAQATLKREKYENETIHWAWATIQDHCGQELWNKVTLLEGFAKANDDSDYIWLWQATCQVAQGYAEYSKIILILKILSLEMTNNEWVDFFSEHKRLRELLKKETANMTLEQHRELLDQILDMAFYRSMQVGSGNTMFESHIDKYLQMETPLSANKAMSDLSQMFDRKSAMFSLHGGGEEGKVQAKKSTIDRKKTTNMECLRCKGNHRYHKCPSNAPVKCKTCGGEHLTDMHEKAMELEELAKQRGVPGPLRSRRNDAASKKEVTAIDSKTRKTKGYVSDLVYASEQTYAMLDSDDESNSEERVIKARMTRVKTICASSSHEVSHDEVRVEQTVMSTAVDGGPINDNSTSHLDATVLANTVDIMPGTRRMHAGLDTKVGIMSVNNSVVKTL